MIKDEVKNKTLADITTQKIDDIVESGESSDLVSLIAIGELTNLEKLKTISRVKAEQIPIMSKLYLYSEHFNIPFMKNLADNILSLQISIHGLGRKELVSVVNQSQPITQPSKSFFERKEVFR